MLIPTQLISKLFDPELKINFEVRNLLATIFTIEYVAEMKNKKTSIKKIIKFLLALFSWLTDILLSRVLMRVKNIGGVVS